MKEGKISQIKLHETGIVDIVAFKEKLCSARCIKMFHFREPVYVGRCLYIATLRKPSDIS